MAAPETSGVAVAHAGCVDEVAGGEVVGAVDDDVGARHFGVKQGGVGPHVGKARTCTPGLRAAMRAAADSTLSRSRLLMSWAIWRCRLVSDTVSWSTSVMRPTPAEAR